MRSDSPRTECAPFPESMLLGGRGGMAGQLRRFLPGSPRTADILDLGNERRVRRAIGGFLHHDGRGQRKTLDHVVFSLLPQEVYAHALRIPGRRARVAHVLGLSGAGQTGTLLVPCASVLSTPTEVLAGASGPVIGLHLMYGPKVTDLSRETAILCAPAWTRGHHLYPSARGYLRDLLTRMGHGRVLELSPDQHDALMAEVQFLTHSLFLCLGESVRAALGGSAYRADSLPLWLDDALQIVQRILLQPAHVYAGIARDNPLNSSLARTWLTHLAALGHVGLGDLVMGLLDNTRRLSAEFRRGLGLKVPVTTPVSRYRDHLLQLTPHWSGPLGFSVDAAAVAAVYQAALTGDYRGWFSGLAGWFPERPANRSDELIARLTSR